MNAKSPILHRQPLKAQPSALPGASETQVASGEELLEQSVADNVSLDIVIPDGVLPDGAQVRDDEQALYVLLQSDYNVEEAIRRKQLQTTPPIGTHSFIITICNNRMCEWVLFLCLLCKRDKILSQFAAK